MKLQNSFSFPFFRILGENKCSRFIELATSFITLPKNGPCLYSWAIYYQGRMEVELNKYDNVHDHYDSIIYLHMMQMRYTKNDKYEFVDKSV